MRSTKNSSEDHSEFLVVIPRDSSEPSSSARRSELDRGFAAARRLGTALPQSVFPDFADNQEYRNSGS